MPKLGATLVPLNTRLAAAERRGQLEQASVALLVEEPLAGAEADFEPPPSVDPDAAWTLLFTSGTGGRPKPVALSYRNHVASALACAWGLGVAPDDRWLCVLPLFHVGGLAIPIRALVHGTEARVHGRFDVERAGAELALGEATLVSLVPAMLRRLLDAGLAPHAALRAVLLGGASAPADLLARAARAGLPVVRTYGMTETASQVALAPQATAAGQPPPPARPLPGVELRIASAGELLIRGPMVARDALGDDGWLHTRDRAALASDGALTVDGRLDETIVTGGENVTAAEVERALLADPAVIEAGVAGVPDADWGEAVAACVVVRHGTDVAGLRERCRARIAPYKVPKWIVLVDELPRNSGGKLDRAALGALLSGR